MSRAPDSRMAVAAARGARRLGAGLVVAWLLVAPVAARGGITEGVGWIVSHQDASGLWGVTEGTPFRDATTAVEALNAVGQGASAIANALPAIEGADPVTIDFLARKIIGAASAGDAPLAASLAVDLAALRNTDGGFGYQAGYASSNLETALALIAFRRAGYTNGSVLAAAINYLRFHRNGDNGWSLTQGGTSEVFYTAEVVIALAHHQDVVPSTTEVTAAVTWLRTQDHGDGGFGSNGTSNAYETGLAMAALVRGGFTGTEVTNAQAYLLGTQLGNGSWNDDAYATASAIYGLNHSAPDLAIAAAEVTLSIPFPLQGDVVNFSAVVRNRGAQTASGVITRFYDGVPGQGGVQIGADQFTASLAAGASASPSVSWNTAGLAGDHTLVVVTDPGGAIVESEEINNRVNKSQHVRFPADLVITSSGVAVTPAEPDTTDAITVAITVRNEGENTATNVGLQLWAAPYASGVGLLGGGYNIPSITAGGQFTLNVNLGNFFTSSGEKYLFAWADFGGTIGEINESNNSNRLDLQVGRVRLHYETFAGVDLLALPLTPLAPLTSYTLLPDVPDGTRLEKWNRATQSYNVTTNTAGVIGGDLYNIDLLDGYFTRVATSSFVDFYGRRVTTHPCTSLQTGLNLVSSPNADACYSAFSLLESMTGGVEAHGWNAARQQWESGFDLGGGTMVGTDFTVQQGKGYFVRVSTPSSWCVAVCDTAPASLPDLMVATTDILLDPNPVASGAPCGVYVNIHNLGAVAVVSPRLDIYLGNPSAGGTLLLSGALPVTIAPGGTSGYWGNTFTFTGAGTASIYGIADYANTVAESNETNNQASRLLTITAAPLEGAGATPIALVAEDGPKPFEYRRVAAGSTPAAGRAPAPEHTGPGTRTTAATVIRGVGVAGISSSSATIVWSTDGTADGTVRYGPTSALGWDAFDTIDDDLHVVTLEGLDPETSYSFKVQSDGLTDNNGGALYTFTTAKVGAGVPSIAHGRIVDVGTTNPVADVAVLATMLGGSGSQPLFARSGAGGRFVLNFGNLKDAVTRDVMTPAASGFLQIRAEGATRGHGTAVVAYSGASPRNLGDIELYPGLVDVPGGESTARTFALRANLPNPFGAGTMIGYDVPVRSPVRLAVFDLQGRRVRLLEDRAEMSPGSYRVSWDGRDDTGHALANGVYFYRLEARGFTTTRKAVLSRD